jgi:hypothetical protein
VVDLGSSVQGPGDSSVMDDFEPVERWIDCRIGPVLKEVSSMLFATAILSLPFRGITCAACIWPDPDPSTYILC